MLSEIDREDEAEVTGELHDALDAARCPGGADAVPVSRVMVVVVASL